MSVHLSYLEDVRLKNVVSQFHGLLPIEFPFLTGQHECDESVTGPVRHNRAVFRNFY